MNQDFRLGCSRRVALRHLSEEELIDALKAKKLEEVGGLYYSVFLKDKSNMRDYLPTSERPLRWNAGADWALPGYAP